MKFFEKKANVQFILFLLLLVVFFAFKYFTKENTKDRPKEIIVKPRIESSKEKESNQSSPKNADVPSKVVDVFNHIQKFHKAPQGYEGGRIFQNREQKLPLLNSKGIKIKYNEWDVNPKIKGSNRGAERLITGSDSSAYYSDNHYKSFKKFKP